MDFLSKKCIYQDKNTIVTKLTDVLTHDFFYIIKTSIQGNFKKELSDNIFGLDEKDALNIIKKLCNNANTSKNNVK